jgi:WXG100 family type VII secretion target
MAQQTILRVTTEELERTVGSFSGNLSTVQSLTSQMLQLIQGLSSTCNGEPFDAFRTKAEGLNNDMEQVKKMIQGHMDELTSVAGIMKTFASENESIVNGLPADAIS